MPKGGGVWCIESQAVCRWAGIPPSTLDYWVRTGLVSPSVRGSSGRRRTRLWSIQDAVSARAIKVLRDAGCPLQTLRRARKYLKQNWELALSGQLLYWDGQDLLGIGPWDAVESLVREPGQQAFRLVALPLDRWAQEASAHVIEFRRPTKGATHTAKSRKRRAG